MVPKKNGNFQICIDFRKLNMATKKYPHPLPFTDEVLNIVTRYESYSFLDGFLSYHQISIALKDRYNTTFVINLKAFTWKVMPFGVNGLPTYHKVVTKTYKEYLDKFMKIFLDDFIMYKDMDNHLQKFRLCFQKCKEYDISLNLDKCAFMVFLRMILMFPKKIQAMVNMPPPKNP